MRSRREAKFLTSDDLDLLQMCFDELLKRNSVTRDSQDAETMASAPFRAYGRGVTDKRELMRLADMKSDVAA